MTLDVVSTKQDFFLKKRKAQNLDGAGNSAYVPLEAVAATVEYYEFPGNMAPKDDHVTVLHMNMNVFM